jgi:hypothetical protein
MRRVWTPVRVRSASGPRPVRVVAFSRLTPHAPPATARTYHAFGIWECGGCGAWPCVEARPRVSFTVFNSHTLSHTHEGYTLLLHTSLARCTYFNTCSLKGVLNFCSVAPHIALIGRRSDDCRLGRLDVVGRQRQRDILLGIVAHRRTCYPSCAHLDEHTGHHSLHAPCGLRASPQSKQAFEVMRVHPSRARGSAQAGGEPGP